MFKPQHLLHSSLPPKMYQMCFYMKIYCKQIIDVE